MEEKPIRGPQKAEMSFREIAHVLGIQEIEAWVICRTALRKLKRNPQAIRMLELAMAKQEMRQSG